MLLRRLWRALLAAGPCVRARTLRVLAPVLAACAWTCLLGPAAGTELGVEGSRFLLDNKPTFLLGISYYAGLGAPAQSRDRDFDQMQRLGFNWIRVWATWSAFENDVSAVDFEGRPRREFLARLKELLSECDRRGMVVDVTLSRGNGVTGPVRLQRLEWHRRAVETLVADLKPLRNWYLDLSNERNIKDKRFTSFEDLKVLRDAAQKLDPKRLITASHAGDLSEEDVRKYVEQVRVDFLSPHRPRHRRSPAETAQRTRQYRQWLEKLGRVVPVHYQEPFRRGFTKGWEPAVEDFLADAKAAYDSGAAGWCLHNGDERQTADGRPRRSFDLRERRLFEQLDDVELQVCNRLRQAVQGRTEITPQRHGEHGEQQP